MAEVSVESRRLQAIYNREAPTYDRREAVAEWLLLARVRRRLLGRARGRVLEVAVGTGRNLAHYPPGCELSGVDLSPEMLRMASRAAKRLGRPVSLALADATRLPFPDHTFDTVVSTLSLCTIPQPELALAEMRRVSRPQGHILLLEHVRGTCEPVGRLLDWLEPWQARQMGCHPNRRTVELVRSLGLPCQVLERHLQGIIVSLEVGPLARSG